MNPFDLPGPQFLGFYALFSAAVLAFLWANTRGPAETRATLSFMTEDPYRIAFMRKGAAETLQVAIFNLVVPGNIRRVVCGERVGSIVRREHSVP